MKKLFVWVACLFSFFTGTMQAQSFVTVVAADGSGTYKTIQEAVNACPEDGQRHLILVRNGIYKEMVNIPKNKLISLIGEDRDKVILTFDRNRGKNSRFHNFRDITTLQCYADDFYMENMTVANTAGNVGQAEAHFISGDRQTYKHCKFTGYQDTQRTKGGVRSYLQDCWIEGAVDFIYGEGLIYYDRCVINCVKGGGYITAPAECSYKEAEGRPLQYGYIFRQCDVVANHDVPEGSYYLGRPWKKEGASYFVECNLGKHIHPAGWQVWNGNEQTASFAEYGSKQLNGKPADVSKRAAWSFQLTPAEMKKLTPEYIFSKVNGEKAYDPLTICRSVAMPAYVRQHGNHISWSASDKAVGYLVYRNGKFIAAVDGTSFTDNQKPVSKRAKADKGAYRNYYTVKAVAASGATSKPVKALTDDELELKAFPTAEGFGKYATGGRGGKVVTVTNLADDPKGETVGSLRWALNQYPSDFTVVFAVSGNIELVAPLRINKKNYTIAGQTAPGDGICITRQKVNVGGSHNFIIRHVRFRMGNKDVNGQLASDNSFGAENCVNFIIDHCTFGWSAEENMNTFDDHFHTVQWCILHEGLYDAGHKKGVRGYGCQWGGSSATYHHNLLANNSSRSCRFNGARGKSVGQDLSVFIEFINNVNYNWGRVNSCYGGENTSGHPDYFGHEANFINNYYKPGPATPKEPLYFFEQSMARKGSESRGPSRWYMDGNVMFGNKDITKDNWKGFRLGRGTTYQIKDLKSDTPIRPTGKADHPKFHYDWEKYTYKNYQSAEAAFDAVIANAGAFPRDRVDSRLMRDMESGIASYGNKGIINTAEEAEGYQVYGTHSVVADKDGDGMDDAWEVAHGLDPKNPEDRNLVTKLGYTMLEVYLNSLVGENIPM